MNKACLSFPIILMTIGIISSFSLIYRVEARLMQAVNNLHSLSEYPHSDGSDMQSMLIRIAADLSTPESAVTEPYLTIQNNRISAWLKNYPLNRVLQEVGVQSHIVVMKADAQTAIFEHIPVTAQFEDLPLDQGLQILLQDVDSFYFYQAGEQEAAMLQTVWVYPKGQGETMHLVSSTTRDPTQALRANLSHADPDQRIAALKEIIKYDKVQAEPYILAALEDLDDSVRLHALQSAFQTGINLSVDLLGDLLQFDTFPRIRFLALHAIARDSETNRWLIEQALSDPDEKIQMHAKTLLEGMVVDAEDDHAYEGHEDDYE